MKLSASYIFSATSVNVAICFNHFCYFNFLLHFVNFNLFFRAFDELSTNLDHLHRRQSVTCIVVYHSLSFVCMCVCVSVCVLYGREFLFISLFVGMFKIILTYFNAQFSSFQLLVCTHLFVACSANILIFALGIDMCNVFMCSHSFYMCVCVHE